MAKRTKGTGSGSSLKNPQLYEELRDDGASKEKAARISNAVARDGATAVGKRGGAAPPYEHWTMPDLRQRAKELGVSGYSKLRKTDLIKKIRTH